LGVAGAAISTLVSQAAAAVAILICQTRPGQTIEVGNLIKIRPNFHMIWLVLCIGIPTGIENAMFQFGKLVVQSTVSTLGTTAIASNAVVVVLELLTSTPSMAIGLGLMTVVGQCVGAGKLDEARYYTKKLTIWSFVVLFVVNWLIYFITPAVTSIAGMEADAAAMTVRVMLIISIVKPFTWPLAFTPCNGTRAAGDVKFTMIVSTITMWILRVGLATVLCRCLGVGLEGIWCGYFADWTMRSVLFTIRFHGEKWHQHHIIKDI
jgi:Na+-driven multidrug efflux pump